MSHELAGMREPLRALIATDRDCATVAVSTGPELRLIDFDTKSTQTLLKCSTAKDEFTVITRCLAFSRCGNWFASGGDDKVIRLWFRKETVWNPVTSVTAAKKISAVIFSSDSKYVFAATKFGDVVSIPTSDGENKRTKLTVALGHYSSPVICMSMSSDGQVLATADRDGRARLTHLPSGNEPTLSKIKSYCLGHTNFISCCSFIEQENGEIFVTGSGDGTLRVWNLEGEEIAMLSFADSIEGILYCKRAVLSICAFKKGRYAVVAIDGLPELVVVELDVAGGRVQIRNDISTPRLQLCTDLVSDNNDRIYAIGGPLPGYDTRVFVYFLRVNSEINIEKIVPADSEFQLLAYLQGWESTDTVSFETPKSFLPAFLYKNGDSRLHDSTMK